MYIVDKKLVAKILFDEVVCALELDSSYTAEKALLRQECVEFSSDDVADLFEHFNSLDESCLRSLEDVYADKLGATGIPFQSIIKPRITECLFCASFPLSLGIKTQFCDWKAPSGHSWAYTIGFGGKVAAVSEATCPRCRTVYKLQT